MEKRCEFCKALRAVVLCESDAARLCLCCDAKVHSANALSYRHPRTLIVCESCRRQQPALVRCFDHRMFMCRSCDAAHHHPSLDDHHKKIPITCYVGCPSAKDLAQLWGLDLNDQSDAKVGNDGILQQILELKRVQLSEGCIDDDSYLARAMGGPGGFLFRHEDATWKERRMLESRPLEHSDVKTEEQPLMSSPFSQLDNLTSNGNSMHGDPFWHYRSPLHNNEIWLQNMQDLGVCDEVQCFEDVNIPDVDLTFPNLEEFFGGEQDPSFGRIEQADETDDKEMAASDKVRVSLPPHHHARTISPSYSVSSFSMSRITGESSGSRCKDDVSCDLASTKSSGGQEDAPMRYKVKKASRHEKQGQYTSPRSKSDFKKRGKSQMLKVEGD